MPGADQASLLIDVTRTALADVRGHELPGEQVTLDSALQRDLGLDSLARVELLHRVEHAFDVRLPDTTFESVTTLRDLLGAIEPLGPRPPAVSGGLCRAVDADAGEPAPDSAATLIDVLRWHLEHRPRAAGLVIAAEGAERPLSYEQLWQGAAAVAGGLQSHGVAPGAAVALMLPTGADYFTAFMGVLLCGCVPVPIYPAGQGAQLEEHVRRQARILANARVVAMLTDQSVRRVSGLLKAHVPCLRRVATVAELLAADRPATLAPASGESLALLQYTSGSTGDPKGVMLTHAQLLANIRAMGRSIRIAPPDLFVSWLPLYHDMGLIGAWLGTQYYGRPLVVMSPLAFLSRPERWLWAIHRHRATLSAAPNFAYELCVKRIADADLVGLDLSSWRIAFNGAETVLPDTLERFCARFGRYGFRREALSPVYGLAECALGLAFPPPGRGPVIDRVEREALTRRGEARAAARDDPNPLRFVSCGLPLPGYELRVVDAAGRELGERHEGRLEFKGPSATQGYFDNAAATACLKRDGWLDSGDRAYVAHGELYVTGRIKDIVIRGGRHIHPDELEAAIGSVDGVRKGCVAVFGSRSADAATERLVVMAETYALDAGVRTALSAAITARVVEVLGEPPDEVVLVPPHSVLKTSSGKIRRAASRDAYEAGVMAAGPRAVWWQLLRLTAAAVRPGIERLQRSVTRLLYAGWFWLLVCVIGAVTWLAVALLPRGRGAWAAAHLGASAIVAGLGLQLQVHGAEHLARQGPCVLVANHSSYLDGLIVLAVLASPCCFAAKRELAAQLFAGLFLRRLGTLFVTRDEARESVASAEAMTAAVREGRAVMVFPEGTFTRMPGLRPFRLGAFVAAGAARAPVVPIAIRGTRSVLRDGQWFPQRGTVEVEVGPPIAPPGGADPWQDGLALRDAARRYIAAQCGEPEVVAA